MTTMTEPTTHTLVAPGAVSAGAVPGHEAEIVQPDRGDEGVEHLYGHLVGGHDGRPHEPPFGPRLGQLAEEQRMPIANDIYLSVDRNAVYVPPNPE